MQFLRKSLLWCFFCIPLIAQAPAALDANDLLWRSPSRDAAGSMPIGNGKVGANVWCEEDGSVRLLISRTDSFSEASRLLKLGLVTLQLRTPIAGERFEQRLRLRDGVIAIRLGDGERQVDVEVFVDAESDVVHVTGTMAVAQPIALRAKTWRTRTRRLEGEELRSSWTMQDAPAEVVVQESADHGLVTQGGWAGFAHDNGPSIAPFTFARQHLADAGAPELADPLSFRTFGLVLAGEGCTRDPATDPLHPRLVTGATRSFAFRIAAPCLFNPEGTGMTFAPLADLLLVTETATARARTQAWWRAFWNRSWIFVDGDAGTAVPRNNLPLFIGVDSGGGNRFIGTISELAIHDGERRLHAATNCALPGKVSELRGHAFTGLLRLEATITQDAAHPIGRIVDKITPGASDGFLFDTHPGRSLRLIVGDRQLIAENVLTAGRTHRVGATFDPASGRMELLLDGKVVKATKEPLDPAPASRLTQALVLQRWIQACGGRGYWPIKFNGSIFTVPPKFTGGPDFDADWRRWGDCFWWQNTRLPYYPMLAQGDFEMTEPLFSFYLATLPVAEERVRAWYGGKARGAWWPEVMTPFGSHANKDYGWQRDGVAIDRVLCPWWEYARNQSLELLALMLDRWDYERSPGFVRTDLLPLARAALQWFETAYPRDEHGRLRITPTQALETYWHGVQDDMPTVAGLHAVLPRLLSLPADLLTKDDVAAWQKLLQAVPPLPLHEQGGVRMLAPAGAFDPRRSNCENPELSAVFPFRLFGLDRPDLELARAAFARRHDRFTNGWPQDGQVAALLGLVDEARANLLAKAQNHNRNHRFPAMWGPNFDWCPDQCHGSNLLDTTQRMLLQCEGKRIRVLPCWPREWNVAFKLHAPNRTTVTVTWRNGKLEQLEVAPESRRADVVVGPE